MVDLVGIEPTMLSLKSYARVKRALRAEKPCVRQILRDVRAIRDATLVPLYMHRHGCIVLGGR
jgi:hypothetical protein